jgi:hypothetical protein
MLMIIIFLPVLYCLPSQIIFFIFCMHTHAHTYTHMHTMQLNWWPEETVVFFPWCLKKSTALEDIKYCFMAKESWMLLYHSIFSHSIIHSLLSEMLTWSPSFWELSKGAVITFMYHLSTLLHALHHFSSQHYGTSRATKYWTLFKKFFHKFTWFR